MKLNKRECDISIELIPDSADILAVTWKIGGDCYNFFPSSTMGYQFSAFVTAIYQLYSEGYDDHAHNRWADRKVEYIFPENDSTLKEGEIKKRSTLVWFGEGPYYELVFDRKIKEWNDNVSDEEDLIEIRIEGSRIGKCSYTVDGRDLCYSVAKACTDAIKKYGFYGYYSSTGGNSNGFGDVVDIHMILFIKAYALGAMEARKLETIWKGEHVYEKSEATSFEKELELLLFDM